MTQRECPLSITQSLDFSDRVFMFILLLSLTLDNKKRAVFTALFERYKKIMFRDALAILKNKTDAEDAVQNACLSLISHMKDEVLSDIGSDNAKKYVRETVKNASIKILHKRVPSERLNDNISYGDFETDTVEKLHSKELYDAVIRTINEMDEKYRDALYRYFVLGQTVKEIAKQTHTKPDTVEKRIFRGKKIILEKVDPKDYGYE